MHNADICDFVTCGDRYEYDRCQLSQLCLAADALAYCEMREQGGSVLKLESCEGRGRVLLMEPSFPFRFAFFRCEANAMQ
jgi:hypothetical protein